MELIRVEGYVDIFQWDPKKYRHPFQVPEKERIYYVRNAKNIIVENLVKAIISKLINVTLTLTDTGGTEFQLQNSYTWSIDGAVAWDGARLGRDTNTPTTRDMYDLVDEIGVDSDSLLKQYSVTASEAWITWSNTWNAGKITEQIGEVGLYGHATDSNAGMHAVMYARLASADGAFSPFTPDPTYALTVSYKLRFW